MVVVDMEAEVTMEAIAKAITEVNKVAQFTVTPDHMAVAIREVMLAITEVEMSKLLK